MVKNHIKSLNTPKTWSILRKATTFTTRPFPGSHTLALGISINHVLKHELALTTRTKESKLLLNKGECLVNGVAVKDEHYNVGFMDAISFPTIKKHYRISLSPKGKLFLIEISEKEANLCLSKLTGKTLLKGGKIQLNTMNGRNILVKKDSYKTADTLIVDLKKKEITKNYALKKDASIILIGGKHLGEVAVVEKVEDDKIFFTKDDQTYQTLKKYAFVVGEKKPAVTLA